MWPSSVSLTHSLSQQGVQDQWVCGCAGGDSQLCFFGAARGAGGARLLWERRAAAAAAPVLRAAERDLSALPVVWTVSFRFCSQTKLKGFPHGFGLRKGASGVAAAALVHGLQQTAPGQKLCCEHLPGWPVKGVKSGLQPLIPHLCFWGACF